MYKMHTHDIPITGGAGFIGTNLATEMRNCSHQMLTLTCAILAERITSEPICGNCRQVEKLFDDRQFDCVYHLAAEYGRWNGEDYY